MTASRRLLTTGAWIVVVLFLLGTTASANPFDLVFERTWGGPDTDIAWDLAAAPDGALYTAGTTRSFGAGNLDALVLKWASDGTFVWARTWGGSLDDEVLDVDVGPDGNVYAAGHTTSFGSSGDVLVLKFTSDGTLVWARTWGGDSGETARGITAALDGSIYVTGTTFSFGSDVIGFLLKFDANGGLAWERRWDGGPEDLAVGPDGNVYVAGGSFVAKFAPDGTLLSQLEYLAGSASVIEAIAVGPDGTLHLTGRTFDTDFEMSVLVVRVAPDGTLVYDRGWGGRSGEDGLAIAVGADGFVYVAGQANSFAVGSDDFFLLKVLPVGRVKEAVTWGGIDLDAGQGMIVDSSGHLVVAGTARDPPYEFDRAGTKSSPLHGTASFVTGTVAAVAGTLGSPEGTVTAPEGSLTFAGGFDVALIRVAPG